MGGISEKMTIIVFEFDRLIDATEEAIQKQKKKD